MKRLFLISASLMIASATFAQSDDNSLYTFDNTVSAKEVTKLGTAPEFPFLRNLSTPHEVYAAIKKQQRENTTAINKLNGLLMQIGYANGAQDLQQANITEASIPSGTEGNMGSRGYTYGYYRLDGSASELRAWKIAATNGNAPLYLMAKCGNAFYPKAVKSTACVNVPVTVTPDMKQVNLPNSGTVVANKTETFVYYSRRRPRRHETAYAVAGISDKYPSHPIKIDAEKDMNVMPQTYNVSLNSPQDNTVTACPDSTLNLTAGINVASESSYTGNYPSQDNKNYKKVSKRTYKMAARRMRRVHRKEDKIARKTGVPVDVSTANKAA